jgi:hypothetical protein
VDNSYQATDFQCWAPVAHACNPSYLGGRDQEDQVWGQHRQIVWKTISWKYSRQKGLADWSKLYSACLASVRPCAGYCEEGTTGKGLPKSVRLPSTHQDTSLDCWWPGRHFIRSGWDQPVKDWQWTENAKTEGHIDLGGLTQSEWEHGATSGDSSRTSS